MSKGYYLYKKGTKGLKHHFKIKMGRKGKHYLDFYIWDYVETMYDNARPNTTSLKGPQKNDFIGCYIAYPKRLKKGGKFGEIHCISERVGSALVSHEFMHAMLDWIAETFEEVSSRVAERICYTMSDMNYEFWRKYYRYGKTKQPMVE